MTHCPWGAQPPLHQIHVLSRIYIFRFPLKYRYSIESLFFSWCRGVVVITTARLHSTKPEIRFCTGSNPAHGVLEIRDGEDLWQWSQLEIRLKDFRWSTIPQKQFIIIIITTPFTSFPYWLKLQAELKIKNEALVSKYPYDVKCFIFQKYRQRDRQKDWHTTTLK